MITDFSTLKQGGFPIICGYLLSGLLLSASEWDFRSGEVSLDTWAELWTPMTEAAKADRAFRIDPQPGLDAGINDAFILADVYDSSLLNESDLTGTPVISSKFDAMESGKLTLRAGTAGIQNQNAMITLLAKGRPLLILRIVNNHESVVISGAGEFGFKDDQSWFNRAREYTITWDGSNGASVSFEAHSGARTETGPLRLLAPGSPDEIKMQVGFGRATNRELRIETFSLSPKE